MKTYKRIFLYLFLMIVVTGCVNVTTNVPLSSSTASTSETTPTPKPTDIPVTPTETPDPNMPPGATGKDAQGNWIKTVTENGKQAEYVWKDIQVSRETTVNGWFTSHILSGDSIPLIDADTVDGYTKTVPFTFDFQEGVNGPNLNHTEIQLPRQDIPSFSRIYITMLENAYYGKSFQMTKYTERGPNWLSFLSKLQNPQENGNVEIPFTSRSGDFVWTPGPDIGYKVYAVPWDEADPATHLGFYETVDELQDSQMYRWSLSVDAAGNLVAVTAMKDPNAYMKNPNKFTIGQFYGSFLYPMEKLLVNYSVPPDWKLENSGNPISHWGFSFYPTDLVGAAYKFGPEPYFQIVPAP